MRLADGKSAAKVPWLACSTEAWAVAIPGTGAWPWPGWSGRLLGVVLTLITGGNLLAFDPVVVGTWPGSPGTPYVSGLVVRGRYAYLTGSGIMQILDVSDPTHPLALGSYSRTNRMEGRFPEDNGVVGGCAPLAGLGKPYVYVSYWEFVAQGMIGSYGMGIDVLDVSDIMHPAPIAHLFGGGVGGSVICRGMVFAPSAGQVLAYDLRQPDQPKKLGIFGTADLVTSIMGLAVDDHYLYMAGCLSSSDHCVFEIVDVTPPGGPVVMGHLDYSHPVSFGFASVADGFVFVNPFPVGPPGLDIVDVRNPTNPHVVGVLTNIYGTPVVVKNQRAYVANGAAGLQVFDLSNPAKPLLVATQTNVAPAWDMARSGNYAFVAVGPQGVQAVQIDDQPSLSINSSATGASLQLDGVFGQSYVIESCPSLPPATGWTSVTNVALTNATQVVLDTLATTDKVRFYRARQSQ